jgi:hypothetical protein
MALDEHIVEIARLLGGELPPQFPLEGVIGPGLMERLQELGDGDAADAVAGAAGTVPDGAGEEGLPRADGTAEDDFSCWASQCRLKSSRTRARSKLTGLSHTICSKVAVSSKPACSSRRVRPWLSRRSISSWSKSFRNSTWLRFPGAHG